MGCAVNGPGEAGDADFGIAGGRDVGFIYAHGRVLKKVPSPTLIDELFVEIDRWLDAGMVRPKRPQDGEARRAGDGRGQPHLARLSGRRPPSRRLGLSLATRLELKSASATVDSLLVCGFRTSCRCSRLGAVLVATGCGGAKVADVAALPRRRALRRRTRSPSSPSTPTRARRSGRRPKSILALFPDAQTAADGRRFGGAFGRRARPGARTSRPRSAPRSWSSSPPARSRSC